MRNMGANSCYLPKIAQTGNIKADFAFYWLLACDFDIIYTILSSLSKNYMIKPEMHIKLKKNVWYELFFWGGQVRGGGGRS